MKHETLEQTLDKMRDYVYRYSAGGFASAEEIRSSVVEIFSDEQGALELLPYAQAFVREALEAHLKEQAGWGKVTDCDRLNQAFEDLEREGIISRQNFSCCGTCGTAEIVDEMEEAKNQGR